MGAWPFTVPAYVFHVYDMLVCIGLCQKKVTEVPTDSKKTVRSQRK